MYYIKNGIVKDMIKVVEQYTLKHIPTTSIRYLPAELESTSLRDEDGNMKKEFIQATIYSESDTDYYVDTSVLRPGDYIYKPDSENDKYPVSKTGSLVGVYNINKGFADFKEVTILYSNDEYSIVRSNTRYGLTEYDYIVLDAESVKENDFIYE